MGGKKKKSAAPVTPAAAAAAAGRSGAAAAAGNSEAEEPKKQPASNKPVKSAKDNKSKGGNTCQRGKAFRDCVWLHCVLLGNLQYVVTCTVEKLKAC